MVYLLVAVSGAACLAFALVAGGVFGIDPALFYRDAVAAFSKTFVIGWLSNLGGALWFGSAAVLLFTASLLAGPERPPLLVFGALTLVLGFDDVFLLHEGVLPFLGLPGELLVAAYGIGLAVWLFYWRDAIARSRWGLLVAAAFCLGLSVGLDLAYEYLGLASRAVLVAEDAIKLTGIMFWAAYGVGFAYSAATRALSAARPGARLQPAPA